MTAVHMPHAHRAQERIEPCRCSSTVAFNKDAFPTRQHSIASEPIHIACRNKPCFVA